MTNKQQKVLSTLSIAGASLLAANRFAQGHYGWACMWIAVMAAHGWILLSADSAGSGE